MFNSLTKSIQHWNVLWNYGHGWRTHIWSTAKHWKKERSRRTSSKTFTHMNPQEVWTWVQNRVTCDKCRRRQDVSRGRSSQEVEPDLSRRKRPDPQLGILSRTLPASPCGICYSCCRADRRKARKRESVWVWTRMCVLTCLQQTILRKCLFVLLPVWQQLQTSCSLWLQWISWSNANLLVGKKTKIFKNRNDFKFFSTMCC